MRILVDTNVVLDVLLGRPGFFDASVRVFALVESSRAEGMLCATTVTTIDYLLKKGLSRQAARQALKKLLEIFDVAPVNRAVIEEAIKSRVNDFEDAVLEQAGRFAGADAIITRNQKDFRFSALKILGPDEMLATIGE